MNIRRSDSVGMRFLGAALAVPGLFALALAVPRCASAEEAAGPKPLAIVAAAGVDRLLEDVETIAVAADRRDVFETIKGLLGNLGNFEGMDRGKPFGVILYLAGAIPPKPEPVVFVPVANAEKLLRTVAFGPIRTKPVEGQEGRHELVGPDGSAFLQLRGGYAFVAPKGVALDRNVPDLERVAADLAKQYDVAARVDLSTIPEGLRTVAVAAARARAEQDLNRERQKPNADPEALRLHKELSDAALELFESTVKGAREFVVGMEVSQKTKTATVEARLVTDGKPAAERNDRQSTPTRFAVDPAAPARFWVTYEIPENRRGLLRDVAALAEKKALASAAAGDAMLIGRVFAPVKATLASGRLDLLVQLAGAPPGPFTLMGGLQVKESESLAAALPDLLDKLSQSPKIEAVEQKVSRQGEIDFHRIVGKYASVWDERIYGPKPGLLTGVGNDALWFALGGKDAWSDFTPFVTKGGPKPGGKPGDELHVSLAAGTWVAMQGAGNEDARQKLVRDAFIRGKDRLAFELAGAGNGARLRLSVEEGYLRLLGLAIAQKFDAR